MLSEKSMAGKDKKKGEDGTNINGNALEKLYNYMSQFSIDNKGKNNKKNKKEEEEETVGYVVTHTITDAPHGKYHIPETSYNEFRKHYANAVINGHNPHITERHKDFGPIIIDFDFKMPKEKDGRYYTEMTITNIINIYNGIIRKYFNVKKEDMQAYVYEKESSRLRNNKRCDGIHIVYPYICTKPNMQFVMREDFIDDVLSRDKNIFRKIPIDTSDIPIEDDEATKQRKMLEQMFDSNVIYSGSWMLYGSSKTKHDHPYYLTHIYALNTFHDLCDIMIDQDIYHKNYKNLENLVGLSSCRRFFSEKDCTPMYDDINFEKLDEKIINVKNNLSGKKKDAKPEDILGKDFKFYSLLPEDQFIEAKNLIQLLSVERATGVISWLQVGWCLHNIDHRLLPDWIEFSKKAPSKFKKGECEKLWSKMKKNGYTIASLHYFASRDEPQKYEELKRDKIDKLVRLGLECSHYTIAKLLMEKHKFRFKCASIKNNIWYEYKSHRWVESDNACTLYNLIAQDIVPEYAKKQAALMDSLKDVDGHEKKNIINESTLITKMISSKLNDSRFKEGVIRECKYLAYDSEFVKELDENHYLLGFTNGVYDLKTFTFRDGCPDDCISLCTNYDYVEYDDDDDIVHEIHEFMEKIQPDPVARDYLYTILSTCLCGSIKDESFYVFTGKGSNGKSKLMELFKYTLGMLFKPMDIQLLVGKRTSSSSATPEIADKKGVRACPLDEPKATDEINASFMKLLTGGDELCARALYKEPVYFKPQLKAFLLCNHTPNINADDEGTWRRLKVLPFPAKFFFRSDPPAHIKKRGLGKNQYWADTSISERIVEWKEAFMCILIKYYKKYCENGIVTPQIVQDQTKEYRKRCDIFQDFICDYLEPCEEDEKVSIPILKLHNHMKEWYTSNYGASYSKKCPPAKDLRSYVQYRLTDNFNAAKDHLIGYKVKECGINNDQEEDLASLD